MQRSAIDHITVTAPTLAAGAAFVADALGIAMRSGGAHPTMSTHNLLLSLGDTLFLEVIAIDPAAPAPARPRWFELDRLTADAPARLATWVARTTDLRDTAAPPDVLGPIETLTRGSLQWLLTVPADGSLPLGGVAPALIEWQTPSHPAASMPASGCTLHRLDLFHPRPERVTALLERIGFDGPVHVARGDTPMLTAHVDTPGGRRVLG